MMSSPKIRKKENGAPEFVRHGASLIFEGRNPYFAPPPNEVPEVKGKVTELDNIRNGTIRINMRRNIMGFHGLAPMAGSVLKRDPDITLKEPEITPDSPDAKLNNVRDVAIAEH